MTWETRITSYNVCYTKLLRGWKRNPNIMSGGVIVKGELDAGALACGGFCANLAAESSFLPMEVTMSTKRPWILDTRLCWMVLLAFTCLSLLPVNSSASLVPSRLADGSAVSEREGRIESIRQALEQEVVAQRLV